MKSQISLTRQERKVMTELCARRLLDFEADPEMDGSFEQSHTRLGPDLA